jgi:hypothetical protein
MQQGTVGNVDKLRARLDLMQLQVKWLQQEMTALRRTLESESDRSAEPPTFASLYGIWADAEITDQDLEDARIKVPEDLP